MAAIACTRALARQATVANEGPSEHRFNSKHYRGNEKSPALSLLCPPHVSCARVNLFTRPQALELYVHAAQEDGDAISGHRVSLMALKCVNNAIWDQPDGQASFVRLGGPDMLVDLLQARLVYSSRHDAPVQRRG